MKIIVCFILFMQFFIPAKFDNVIYSNADGFSYAKIQNNCPLYKTSSFSYEIDNILFILPESYFVKILQDVDTDCLKVQYDKFVGYVQKSKVSVVGFIPINKFLVGIECDINDFSGTQIWNLPSSDGKILTTLASSTKNLKYYGFVYGATPTGGDSNIWYYVSYTPEQNSTNVYEGYVYSENITNLTPIETNLENDVVVESEANNSQSAEILKTILITLISIPLIIIFAFTMYKLTKIIIKNTNKTKNLKKEISEFNQQNMSVCDEVSQKNSLKSNLKYFSNNSLTKKSNRRFDNYPSFPVYDVDDDLL